MDEQQRFNKGVDGLDLTKENGVLTITINRPKRLNALTTNMYGNIRDILNNIALDDSIKIVVLTGVGKYFSSGNDLIDSAKKFAENADRERLRKAANKKFKGFVNALINFPKLLICAVNGPAVGISATILGLADLVYASDNATFHTPFVTLGLSSEGCSSYTFPNMMGKAKANEVLIAGRKLTAQEAFDRGLVTDIIPQQKFSEFMAKKLKYLAGLPSESVKYAKALTRQREKDVLTRVNDEECARLEERQTSDECRSAMMAFISKQSKL